MTPTPAPKFKIGDKVKDWYSDYGTFIVKEVSQDKNGEFIYRVELEGMVSEVSLAFEDRKKW